MHKKSTKFLVTISYKKIDFEFANNFEPYDINVKWWRQFRTTDTLRIGDSPVWNKTQVGDNGFSSGQANFRFPCEPSLKVTLHKSKKDKDFDKKFYKFAIETVQYDGKAKTLAATELDLSEYANMSRDKQLITLPLEPKKKYVLKAVIYLSIMFDFIRSGNSKDIDMISTWSRESLALEGVGEESAIFVGDGVWDLSVPSLVRKMEEFKCDLLVAEAAEFITELYQSKLIVLVTNSEQSEVSNEIISAINNFYSTVKTKFGKKIELIYLPFDKQRNDKPEPIPELNCPQIKPSSELQNVLTLDFDITSAPNLIVLSQTQLVECSSDTSYILTHLNSKSTQSIIENWLFGPPTDLSKHSTDLVALGEESNSQVLDRMCRSLPETQLHDKISDLRKISLRRSSLFSVAAPKNLTVVQAEKNIRATLMKRGVSGLTGRVWRPRQFQYKDGKIEYLEKKKNEVKGCIELKEVISFDILPNDRQDKNNGTFNVVTRDRVYEMQAMDNEQMKNWITAAETLKRAQEKFLGTVIESLNCV